MCEEETNLFDYWLKMPTWWPYDAFYLLTFRNDPGNAAPETAYIDALALGSMAEHFKLFGLIDDWFVELDGIHIVGKKRPPSEWVECYLHYPDAKPLPFGMSGKRDNPLKTTERNTLLTIIAALCDYSAINHQERGASVNIAKLTEEIGAAVSTDTVKRVLDKIPAALDARKK